jgi:hypothetical protein
VVNDQIAGMLPVGQVINHGNSSGFWANRNFPIRCKTVMIHHDPVDWLFADCFYRPVGVVTPIRAAGQNPDLKTCIRHNPCCISRKLPHQENAVITASMQFRRERKASHYMADAHRE